MVRLSGGLCGNGTKTRMRPRASVVGLRWDKGHVRLNDSALKVQRFGPD